MRAAELAWNGQDEALSTWLDKKAPKSYDVSGLFKTAAVKTADRQGIAWKVSEIKKADRQISFFSAWKASMETNIMADEAADRASTAVTNLKAITDSFRLNVKNDVASMKAASDRVQSEVLQMSDKYKQAMSLLNSPEFSKAVDQAERMAKALECISALSETKLSVAVFAGSKP